MRGAAPLARGSTPPIRHRTSRLLGAIGWLGVCGASACGGGGGPNLTTPDPTLPPSWDPVVTETSADGAWTISMWTAPQPAVKGVDDVVYRITDPVTGAPADGLALQVVPWMPAHGHGTSVGTSVTAGGDGYYLVKPVYLYMSGHWELRTAIGGTDDDVVPTVDIP